MWVTQDTWTRLSRHSVTPNKTGKKTNYMTKKLVIIKKHTKTHATKNKAYTLPSSPVRTVHLRMHMQLHYTIQQRTETCLFWHLCRYLSAIIFAFCSVCCSKWAELANRSRKFSARFGSRLLCEQLRAARRNKSVRHVSVLHFHPLVFLRCHVVVLNWRRGAEEDL